MIGVSQQKQPLFLDIFRGGLVTHIWVLKCKGGVTFRVLGSLWKRVCSFLQEKYKTKPVTSPSSSHRQVENLRQPRGDKAKSSGQKAGMLMTAWKSYLEK